MEYKNLLCVLSDWIPFFVQTSRFWISVMKSGSNRGLPYGWLSTPLAGDKFVSLTHRRPLPSGKYSWCSFLLFLDHSFRFSTGGNFTIIAGQSSGTRKAYAYSHNPVDWPVGCRVAARAIQYYAGSPAGS